MRQQQQQTPAKKNSCSHRSKSRCNVWIVHTSTLFYKKNILSIRWLHLTILIALFYFIYLNQLHHFLLYRNFHTLFFVLQLNESDHPSNQLLFLLRIHSDEFELAVADVRECFFLQRKRFDFVLKTFLLFSSSFGLLVCDESTKGMIKKKEDRENWERQIDR